MSKKKRIKRKLKIKNILIALFILIFLINLIYVILKLPMKNIYIINNNIISDTEIMELSNISNYPSFLLTTSSNIKNKLTKNKYISSVKVEKKWWGRVYIYIEEYIPLCKELSTNKVILSSGEKVDDTYNLDHIPLLLNEISEEIYANFIKKFSLVDKDILLQISEIEYSPVNVDGERFYLSMNDGNYVYVTLTKIKRLNKYVEIREEMDNKHGIIYLDSGNYIEIKD